jgi:hypothetical protein
MKLLHLQIACYLYNQISDYDTGYLDLSEKYPNLDLKQDAHTKALIEWLRSWGCRQFKGSYEMESIKSFRDWYAAKESRLPSSSVHLIDYDLATNMKSIVDIFNDLSARKASTRQRDKIDIDVRMGPVGTAKTLFALRPNLFSPWDTPIYNKFHLKGTGYVIYLTRIQEELREVRKELKNAKIDWGDLFEYLNKGHNSYPKLIDEYFWITITQGCDFLVIESFCNKKLKPPAA